MYINEIKFIIQFNRMITITKNTTDFYNINL